MSARAHGASVKKYIVLLAAVVVLAGAGGGWLLLARRDPLAQANTYLAKGDVPAALVALRAAVRDHPDDADAHLHLSELQLRTGDAVAAEREARAARELRPDNAKAMLFQAQSYLPQGKFKELLSEFPADAAAADVKPSLLLARATAALAVQDVAGAESDARAAEALMPNAPEAPLLLSRAAASRNDWAAADSEAAKALQADPKRVDALVWQAQLLARKNDRAGALARLDQAVAVAPNNEGLLVQRAQLLIESGQDAKARADVDAALKAAGRDLMPTYLNAILLTRAGKYADADPEYSKVNTVIARLPRGYFFLAVNKLALGQGEQALDAAQRFNARAPNDLPGRKLLAQTEIANGQATAAAALLADTAKNYPGDAELQDLLGRAYVAAGQTGQAEQRFARASSLAPNNTGVLARLAATRLALGDPNGASDALEHSLAVSPDQVQAAQSLVAAQIAGGNIAGAEASLAKLKAETGDTEVSGNLQGMLSVAKGQPDTALAQFDAVAKRFPNTTAATLNEARLLLVLGRPGDAERLLGAVLDKDPANGQALGPLLARYAQTNRVDAAVDRVQAALKAQPGNPVLLATLSDLLVRAGKPKDALAATDDAVRGISGGSSGSSTGQPPVAIQAARARALAADGQTALAQGAYNQILRANPNDAEARRQLVEMLVAANDYDSARTAIRDGLKQAPGNSAWLEALMRNEFRANGINGATKLADEMAADPANGVFGQALKGDAFLLANRPADALAAYKASFAKSPSSLLAIRVAATSAAQGHPDDGASVLRAWLKDHPDDTGASQQLAQLDLAANRLPDAAREFEAVLAKQPHDVLSLNNLAWIYQQQNDPRARPTALAAYTQQPTPDTADTLGWIMVTGGDAADGLPLLRQADALRPNTPTVQYHLAVALNATGHSADAAATLDPLVNGPASFPEKADAKRLLDQLKAK